MNTDTSTLRTVRLGNDVEPPRPYSRKEQLQITEARELYIPKCIDDPPHPLHLPDPQRPLRINIEGPLLSIQKLLPKIYWELDIRDPGFPQPGGRELAKLTTRAIYGLDVDAETLVIRDEYLGWLTRSSKIDYYGVTFDHLVPEGEADPETLQINIIETEADGGLYASEVLREGVVGDEQGTSILAVPRCCAIRKGTTDRQRINDRVKDREGLL